MLCSPHWTGNWGGSWSRYTSTDPNLQTWELADPDFITHDAIKPGGMDPLAHIDAAAGPLFNPIPNPAPGGPTHMINGATGQAFWLGTYDPTIEKLHITSDELHWIDIGGGGGPFSGGAAHWAATSNSFAIRPHRTDKRLLWVAWVSSAGRGNLNTLSLVRELRWDHVASRLVSYPVIEYKQLRNATLLPPRTSVGELTPGVVKPLAIPESNGGALDLEVSFDLSKLAPSATASKFGVAARAPADSVAGAAQDVWFEVGVADAAGVRNVTVGGIMNGQPLSPIPRVAQPYPCHRNVCPSNVTTLHPGEPLTVSN
jgi:hypothetical protein